jgi:NAD(P)-dependent dehydrogenase (short-subunit alcohol dehydrogenase family)
MLREVRRDVTEIASVAAWYRVTMTAKRRFEGLVAWITGAGSGIGKALAIELANQGAIVAVSGRRRANLDEVVSAIAAANGKALPVPCDVTDEASLRAAVATIERAHGRIDVVVANAGFSVAGSIRSLTAADWRRQLDTNVTGAALTAAASLDALEKTKGRMVFVASVAAFTPSPRVGAYSASKAALRSLAQTLDIELHGSGVSVTIIHPGFVESEIAQVDNSGKHDATRVDKRPKNLMWPADRAARVMADAIWSRKLEFVFTGHGKVGAFVGQHLPGVLRFAMTRDGAKRATQNATKDAG